MDDGGHYVAELVRQPVIEPLPVAPGCSFRLAYGAIGQPSDWLGGTSPT